MPPQMDQDTDVMGQALIHPETVKIGLIGAGKFGGFHAAKYHAHPGATLLAVFDQDTDCATVLAQKHDAHVYSDLDAFCDAVDAVIVASPASTHAVLASLALQAGRHVFVEKPVALTLNDVDQMIALAQKNNLVLQLGHQERYVAMAAGLLSLPEKPKRMISHRCMPASGRGEDVSAVMDMMIHDLDLVAQIAGQDCLQTMPSIGVQSNSDPFHEVEAKFIFGEGLSAQCVVSRRYDGRERSLTLQFDSGEIRFDFLSLELTNTTPFTLEPPVDMRENWRSIIQDPLAFGAQNFIENIRSNKTPIISAPDGRTALSLALGVEEAATIKTKKTVECSDYPSGSHQCCVATG